MLFSNELSVKLQVDMNDLAGGWRGCFSHNASWERKVISSFLIDMRKSVVALAGKQIDNGTC